MLKKSYLNLKTVAGLECADNPFNPASKTIISMTDMGNKARLLSNPVHLTLELTYADSEKILVSLKDDNDRTVFNLYNKLIDKVDPATFNANALYAILYSVSQAISKQDDSMVAGLEGFFSSFLPTVRPTKDTSTRVKKDLNTTLIDRKIIISFDELISTIKDSYCNMEWLEEHSLVTEDQISFKDSYLLQIKGNTIDPTSNFLSKMVDEITNFTHKLPTIAENELRKASSNLLESGTLRDKFDAVKKAYSTFFNDFQNAIEPITPKHIVAEGKFNFKEDFDDPLKYISNDGFKVSPLDSYEKIAKTANQLINAIESISELYRARKHIDLDDPINDALYEIDEEAMDENDEELYNSTEKYLNYIDFDTTIFNIASSVYDVLSAYEKWIQKSLKGNIEKEIAGLEGLFDVFKSKKKEPAKKRT